MNSVSSTSHHILSFGCVSCWKEANKIAQYEKLVQIGCGMMSSVTASQDDGLNGDDLVAKGIYFLMKMMPEWAIWNGLWAAALMKISGHHQRNLSHNGWDGAMMCEHPLLNHQKAGPVSLGHGLHR